ncbi:hypothetical protein BABINDRAFT_163889 [Babjeviella inositovora NRRL Y-12698]|uniref:Uncharacterized protein n=1 Tax=Babjeviella inositovora NRRL Y-12698 TaxID=984486 RepID=A0A1E3QH12_9ASCO|nr:uncharacterized protein BABINDRAFT_163889 [Babjeviella inositovora NRRL Y-12698]ODQ76985.1 hypothetical protein BABINDRAFT_163889 [Babjeviella inositovora NRRL Y-12698]
MSCNPSLNIRRDCYFNASIIPVPKQYDKPSLKSSNCNHVHQAVWAAPGIVYVHIKCTYI